MASKYSPELKQDTVKLPVESDQRISTVGALGSVQFCIRGRQRSISLKPLAKQAWGSLPP